MRRAWVAATALLLLSTIIVGIDGASATVRQAIGFGPPAEGSAIGTQADRAVGRYGAQLWSIADARMVPRSEDDAFSRPVLVLDVIVNNLTDQPTRITTDQVTVIDSTSSVHPIARFDNTADTQKIVLGPKATATATVVAKPAVGAAMGLSDFRLRLAEPGREPTEIALAETGSEPLFPLVGSITRTGVDRLGGIGRGAADLRAEAVRLDVDLGPYRVVEGHRILIADFAGVDDSLLDGGRWRFVAAETGDQVGAIEASRVSRLGGGDGRSAEVVFIVPAGSAGSGRIEVGPETEPVAAFDVMVTSLAFRPVDSTAIP